MASTYCVVPTLVVYGPTRKERGGEGERDAPYGGRQGERREPCGAESGTLCGYAEYAESSSKPKGSRLDRVEVLYKSDSRFRMSIYYRNLASLYICRYSGYTVGQVWDKRRN